MSRLGGMSPVVALGLVGELLAGGVAGAHGVSKVGCGLGEEVPDDLEALLGLVEVGVAEPGGADLDGRHALALPPEVGVPQRVGAAAVLLLVEPLLRADLVLSPRQRLRLPVIEPVLQAGVLLGSPPAAAVHLVLVLPPRRGVA